MNSNNFIHGNHKQKSDVRDHWSLNYYKNTTGNSLNVVHCPTQTSKEKLNLHMKERGGLIQRLTQVAALSQQQNLQKEEKKSIPLIIQTPVLKHGSLSHLASDLARNISPHGINSSILFIALHYISWWIKKVKIEHCTKTILTKSSKLERWTMTNSRLIFSSHTFKPFKPNKNNIVEFL